MQDSIPNITSEAYNLKHIAHNKCYEISYAKANNRLYFTVLGFWKNKESVPDLLFDWEKALQLVAPGFTVLVDMRTMITHPQDLNGLHKKLMQMVRDANADRVANVMPEDRIASLQVAEIALHSNLQIQTFESYGAAEKWLGQPSV